MYEFVRCHPASRSTASRVAVTADRAGFDGVVLRNPYTGGSPPDYDVACEDELSVDVVRGVEVQTNSVQEMHGYVGNLASKYGVVCVRGGDEDVERAAAESDDVDVIAAPQEFDHVTVREAAENDVALEIDLGPVLRDSGGRRVSAIQKIELLTRLAEKHDASLVVSGSPDDHLEVRGRRELRAVAGIVGVDEEDFEAAADASHALTRDAGDADVEVVE